MKRLFSMIAAPIMAFFAGANNAAPAESVTTTTPTAVVQEATPEQTPQEITQSQTDPQDQGLSGKVVSIDGSTVTVAPAQRPEQPADGEKPADDQQPADGEAPAKPEGDQLPPRSLRMIPHRKNRLTTSSRRSSLPMVKPPQSRRAICRR